MSKPSKIDKNLQKLEKKRKRDEDQAKKTELISQNKNIVKDSRLFKIARLEQQDWYMGMLDFDDVKKYLAKKGDFAVRAAERQNTTQLILDVCVGENTFNIVLLCSEKTNKWSLIPPGPGVEMFDTIPELIKHYQENELAMPKPYESVRLEFPCKRPTWILTRKNIEYSKQNLLGEGNFCKVYRGELNKLTDVAIKVCHDTSNQKSTANEIGQAIMARDALIKEGKIMESMRHSNVIKFYGICCGTPPVLIVMELCSGGSLLEHLKKFGDKISTGERLKFAIEAAEGMSYLHSKELIHRDLAARNCLISKYGVVEIADFGLSKILDDIVEKEANQQMPLRWMAPESLRRERSFSDKSDVWAYGVMLLEIFGNGKKPWEDWEHKKISHYIRKVDMPDFPDRTPKEVKSLVSMHIWVLDPEKRWSFKAILEVLEQLQSREPLPKIMTVSEIPGVTVLSKEDIKARETEQEPDIAKTVMRSCDVFESAKELVMPRTPVRSASRKTSQKMKKSLRKHRQKRVPDFTEKCTQGVNDVFDESERESKVPVSPRKRTRRQVHNVDPFDEPEKKPKEPPASPHKENQSSAVVKASQQNRNM